MFNAKGDGKILISDYNENIINLYKDIRDDLDSLLHHLKNYQKLYNKSDNKQDSFKKIKHSFNNDPLPRVGKSAMFIFLTGTCFYGATSFSDDSEFMSNFGKVKFTYKTDKIITLNKLLNNERVELRYSSYEAIENNLQEGDFIYLDPPYDDQSIERIGYAGGFDETKQIELKDIKYHSKLRDLLTLLAYQIGSEISYSEIGQKLGMGKDTVARYVDLLVQSFVFYTLGGFSRNLRKEVNRKPKIYFYDLGIRNAVIGNFNSLEVRNDIGALWENFLVMERIKRNSYTKHYCKQYFWRTYTGAELDYVEEYDGELHGYEFKWNKVATAPKTWIETYKREKASFECIDRDNWLKFVL